MQNKIKKIMKKKLAIEGHATRGKDVIEILEILGGKNEYNYKGKNPLLAYYIDDRGEIDYINNCNPNEDILRYTLEEFLEKYPYKIGNMIRVPEFESEVRINDMKWDGYNIQYEVFTDETEWYTAEELNQFNDGVNDGVNMKKDPRFKIGDKAIYDEDVVEIVKFHWHLDQYVYYFYHNGVLRSSSCYGLKSCKQVEPKKINQNPLLQQLKKYFEETPRDVIEKEWNEYDKYNEIGPTVNEYLEYVNKSRQPQYPKTYEECCGILKIPNDERYIDIDVPLDYNKLLSAFTELLICCDAYWKIAGEQLGLGKPWEPDWKGESWRQLKYCITVNGDGEIEKRITQFDRKIFAFPTEEMMNAFYENFKDKLEICKEFI